MIATNAIRRRISAIEKSKGLTAPPPTSGDDRRWRALFLPEGLLGEGWEYGGRLAVQRFALHHDLTPEQIVPLAARGNAQAVLKMAMQDDPATAATELKAFLAAIDQDAILAGLTVAARGELEREASDVAIRRNSRKPPLDFKELRRLRHELRGLPTGGTGE